MTAMADAQPTGPIRIGTRGSALATTQSGHVGELLTAASGRPCELVTITTRGDTDRGPLAAMGGTGVFVAAVRDALLAGEVDVVVHSCKDLPTAPVPGIALAATPPREQVADVLCTRGQSLDELPAGAVIGTGSPRRVAQLLARRPDLKAEPIRGNVDTRLRAVAEGRLDGVILAHAGLARLGLLDRITQTLDWLPAPAQGALAVECRENEADFLEPLGRALDEITDPGTQAEVEAERALLAALEAGCAAPVGARAIASGPMLILSAAAFALDGSRQVAGELSGLASQADELGRSLAERLLADGARELIDAAR